jgi:hypothetical protein
MSMPPSKSSAAAKTATKTKRSTMTDAHKEALALGRTQGRAVRVYLEALERNRPRRGRKRTADSIRKQLTQIEDKIGSADPLQRLHLMQARRDLTVGLEKESGPVDDMPALEKEFIVAAREYGDRKGILYSTWREAGVPPGVLEKAGIRRGGQA